MSQLTGKCIFCSVNGSLTKQHIIPNRLRRLVPRLHTTHQQVKTEITFDKIANVALVAPSLQQHQGHVGNRRWRKVCKRCNEGWIKDIETAGFDILSGMIQGNTPGLTVEEQHNISLLFISITCMVDIDDIKYSMITQEERSEFFATRCVPKDWFIFLGRSDANEWTTRFRHYGMSYHTHVVGAPDIEVKRGQVTTVGMGKMIFQAVSGHMTDNLDTLAYPAHHGIYRVLPSSRDFHTSELPILDNLAIDHLADVLYNERLLSR